MSNYEDDSDEDYQDVGQTAQDEQVQDVGQTTQDEQAQTNSDGKRVRGKDIEWVDSEQFENIEEFHNSSIFQNLKTDFVCRRKREPEYADTEHYNCKFARNVGFLPCEFQFKVNYLSTCDIVIVQTAKDISEHIHMKDPDYQNSGNFF